MRGAPADAELVQQSLTEKLSRAAWLCSEPLAAAQPGTAQRRRQRETFHPVSLAVAMRYRLDAFRTKDGPAFQKSCVNHLQFIAGEKGVTLEVPVAVGKRIGLSLLGLSVPSLLVSSYIFF